MPVTVEAARIEQIAAAVRAAGQRTDAERRAIPYRRQQYLATVISLDLDLVVLNPYSHRIKAQLQSHQNRDVVLAQPFADQAQKIISDVLIETQGYAKLKDNLAHDGQLEPGIITHKGVLINANTRAVALRELRSQYISVAVLPEDATDKELLELEAYFQRPVEFRQDYSFTNELLMVEDHIAVLRRGEDAVALTMGWATSASPAALKKGRQMVQLDTKALALIREVQSASNGRIPLVWFDDKRQHVTELVEEYDEAHERDPAKANRVRVNRIAAMLADIGYRDIRTVDDAFVDQYLVPALQENELLGPHIESLVGDDTLPEAELLPGIDLLPGLIATDATGNVPPRPRSTARLVTVLATSAQDDAVTLSTGSASVTMPRERFLSELRTVLETAAEDARLDRKRGTRLTQPAGLLRSASKDIRRATDIFGAIRDNPAFDHPDFESAKEELARAYLAFDNPLPESTHDGE